MSARNLVMALIVLSVGCSKDRNTGTSIQQHSASACPVGIEGDWQSEDGSANYGFVRTKSGELAITSNDSRESGRLINGNIQISADGSQFQGHCAGGRLKTVFMYQDIVRSTEWTSRQGQIEGRVTISRQGQAARVATFKSGATQ